MSQDKLNLTIELKTQIDRKFKQINKSLKQILGKTNDLKKNFQTVDSHLLQHKKNVDRLVTSYRTLNREVGRVKPPRLLSKGTVTKGGLLQSGGVANVLGAFGLSPSRLGVAGLALGSYRFVKSAAEAGMRDEVASTKMRTIFKGHSEYLKPQLDALAAQTPLSKNNLYNSSITLGASGMSPDKIAKTLQRLGDIAGGDPYKLQTVATAYSRTFAMGKLQGQEKNMIMDATGANLLKEVADITGESVKEVADRMRKGKVSIDEVTAAIVKMTEEGGKFYKGMESMSNTATGKISTLRDNWDTLMIKLSENVLPALIKAVDGINTVVNWTKGPDETNLSPEAIGSWMKSKVKSGADTEQKLINAMADSGMVSKLFKNDDPALKNNKKLTEFILSREDSDYQKKLAEWEEVKERDGVLTEGQKYWRNVQLNAAIKSSKEKFWEKNENRLDIALPTQQRRDLIKETYGSYMSTAIKKAKEEVKNQGKAKNGETLQKIGTGIHSGGRRVQQVNVEIQQMIGLNAPELTDLTTDQLEKGIALTPTMLQQVITQINKAAG